MQAPCHELEGVMQLSCAIAPGKIVEAAIATETECMGL